jgi:hypothetical protein
MEAQMSEYQKYLKQNKQSTTPLNLNLYFSDT